MVNSISRIKPVKALIDKVRFAPINTKNYNKNLNKDIKKTVYTNIDFKIQVRILSHTWLRIFIFACNRASFDNYRLVTFNMNLLHI